MSNYVFVLDSNKTPLNPTSPAKARKLLSNNKAAVFRRYPFTIILKKASTDWSNFTKGERDITSITPKSIELKIDPGSKTTGFALVKNNKVIFGAELTHRGFSIKNALECRKNLRRSRRNRKTRYRKARFLNRTKPKGWLPPSLKHRVLTILTWVKRFIRLAPIKSITQELVRFDLQKLENPEISGVEYQQGELTGYEVKEYLLEKWGRKCVYCDKENVPLQTEHIQPKAKGGTNRISNLTLSCDKCNKAKGTKDIEVFLSKKPELLKLIKSKCKTPLKDATAVNATRWDLFNNLKSLGIPVFTGSGGMTKFNRKRFNLPKNHWIDAACAGKVNKLELITKQPLLITCKGWGSRQMVANDKYGFPRKNQKAKQKAIGWNTGDIVNVLSGKHQGIKGKRLKTVRFKGSFDIRINKEKVIAVNRKDLICVHSKDGYEYGFIHNL